MRLRPGYRHKSDMNSLMMRETEANPKDGIRLLEVGDDPSGRGFRMIIITPTQVEWLRMYSGRGIAVDDTHNVTKYNLKFATVSVADQRDRGLPAAFLLSGTMAAYDVHMLFAEIQKLVPDFNPHQIVTDEAPCFYNGCRETFPTSQAKLHYCRWHLDQTFRKATIRLVEVSTPFFAVCHRCYSKFLGTLEGFINKDLSRLLLIADLETFERKFAEILAFLDVEGQTAMATYLRENYLGDIVANIILFKLEAVGRTATWASFANQHVVMDTKMISERWHLRLKKDFLHRNSNIRADFLVDLLIKAVEDLADTNEIRDRRRAATSSYRVQETTKCHRKAMLYYERRPQRIRRIGEMEWQVEGKQPTDLYTVTQGECRCDISMGHNVHCPLCNICPYSWNCLCLDNRSGISCLHRHAVKLYGGEIATRISSAEPVAGEGVEGRRLEVEEALPPTLEPSTSRVTTAQERKQERSQMRNDIESRYAVVYSHVNVLVNTDTAESLDSLKEIYELIDQASRIRVRGSVSEPNLAVRPELTKLGGKPLLTKAELFTARQVQVDSHLRTSSQ
ncbi:unnamed protein product [Cylicocyclus nassatus]|uniref:MULE transposase domain-containing protein n=1 Tax=Cylicocyclus nassatus TaxID=53992 RepID=A0AA36GY22_CYLNA|nr:unnamed protein product [Cylicocyclus nassatus]